MPRRNDLGIGKTSDYKDHKELIVYIHKQQQFVKLNPQNYFKHLSPENTCSTCPFILNSDISSKFRSCTRTLRSFSEFVTHLGYSETKFGERICFGTDEKIPDISIYNKFRQYGDLHKYMISLDDYLVFDPRANLFTRTNKIQLGQIYSEVSVKCDFCPCSVIVYTTFKFLRHIQSLEKKHSCFFVFGLDEIHHNDQRNKDRLNRFLRSNQTSSSKNTNPVRNLSKSLVLANRSLNNQEQSSEEEDEENFNTLQVSLPNLNRSRVQTNPDQNRNSLPNLDSNLIINQNELELVKRNEDFELKEKSFTFKAALNLTKEDLSYLMKKNGVDENDYEIDNADLVLNLHLKKETKVERTVHTPKQTARKSTKQQTQTSSFKTTSSLPKQTSRKSITRPVFTSNQKILQLPDISSLKVGSDIIINNKKIKIREIVYSNKRDKNDDRENMECSDNDQTIDTCGYETRKRKADEVENDFNANESEEAFSDSNENNHLDLLSEDSNLDADSNENQLVPVQNNLNAFDLVCPPRYSFKKIKVENEIEENND